MVEFWTTKKLAPFEGLTIVVGWQKGLITHPTPKQKIFYFLRDNALLLLLLWAIIGFLILLFIAVFSVFEARRINQSGVIVPLFYPPTGMAPSEVAFMTNLGFEEKSVAFDIVQLAVNGYITISSEGKSIFGKHTYTLTRTQKETLDEKEREPLNKIFSKSNSITLAHGQNQHLNSLVKQRKKQLENEYKSYISKKFREMATLVGMLWGIQVFAIVFFVAKPMIQELWVVGLGLFFLYGFAIAFCKLVYTKEGRALQDRIDGFKLFLVTTELERMKIIGTPPTKTPELYEHYLPYAMALGVEKQWTTQFATLFETLEKKGTPYRPRWYVGTSPFRGNFGQFGAQLGSSFASSIASSSTPPGRSSGFGGGGGSGRGGGGGGGRGR